MNGLSKLKKEMVNEFEELVEMDSDLVSVKSSMTISALGSVLKKFNELSGDLLEILSKKDNYDTNLTGVIEKAISDVADKFSKIQPPTINVEPKINVDLKPIQSIASEIKNQGQTILQLVEKINSGNKSEELYRLTIALVNKQLSFLEKSFEQIDITPQLNKISEGINKRPTEWEAWATEWSNSGGISKMKFKVTK